MEVIISPIPRLGEIERMREMGLDFYCPLCKKCLLCEKDVQIDMGCTMDLCSYHYLTLKNDFYDSILVPDWKYERLKSDLKYVNKCPFNRFINAVKFIKNVDSILPKEDK